MDQVPTEWVKIRPQLAKSAQVRVSKAFREHQEKGFITPPNLPLSQGEEYNPLLG